MLYIVLPCSEPFQGWNFVGIKVVAVVFRGESFAHGWCGIVRLCSWLNFEKCDFYMNSTWLSIDYVWLLLLNLVARLI